MRYFYYFLLVLCFSCNKDNDNRPVLNKEECQPIQEFHFTCFENEECVSVVSYLFIRDRDGSLVVWSGLRNRNGISESILIDIDANANFEDTLWFGGNFFGRDPNMASVLFEYNEGSSSAGTFKFSRGLGTKNDFLIIDSFNADTSIIEGYFQCKFPVRQVNDFVNAPDTMRLSCGRFKVKRM